MSVRPPHMLRPTKGVGRPTNVLFFDTETSSYPGGRDRTLHKLKLGVAIHTRTLRGERLRVQSELIFTDKSQFWDYVQSKCRSKSTLYLVAHNIIYDLVVMDGFVHLAEAGWTLTSWYSKGITSIFRWRRDKRIIVGVDNTNLFAGKLAHWGKVVDLPKLSVDFNRVSDADLTVYCRRDVEIMIRLWRTWLDYLDRHDCGAFKTTVASTSLNAWRHRWMPVTVHIHSDPLALQLEREAYRGGRIEALYQGHAGAGPYYYLDVNGMYAYVLSRYSYPAGLWRSIKSNSLSQMIRRLNTYAMIARVEIETPEPWFPVLMDGFTTYPVGHFVTTLTTPELVLCFQRGWLRGVSAMAWYRQAPLFGGYVQYYHNLRQQYEHQGNHGYAQICKLLLNSLYGKFGQLGYRQKLIGPCDPHRVGSESTLDIHTGEIYRTVYLAGGVYEIHKSGEGYNSCAAIAAHVTAYARLYLMRLRMLVPQHHVYYTDTDSLIVDQVGLESLRHMLHPSRLGALKIEHQSDDLDIYAPKDYKMGERVRTKGISPNAVELAPGSYAQEQWLHMAGLVEQGDISHYGVDWVTKTQQRVIHSGEVTASGWIVPYQLGVEQAVQVAPLLLSPAEW